MLRNRFNVDHAYCLVEILLCIPFKIYPILLEVGKCWPNITIMEHVWFIPLFMILILSYVLYPCLKGLGILVST